MSIQLSRQEICQHGDTDTTKNLGKALLIGKLCASCKCQDEERLGGKLDLQYQ